MKRTRATQCLQAKWSSRIFLQSVVLFIAVLYLLINLVVDIAYGFLDPRIRLSWSGAR